MTNKYKKNPLLNEIAAGLSGRLPETTVESMGHTYVLRILKPEGEDWVAMNTEGNTPAAMLLNARKPTIAAALVSIDGQPVEALFQPSEELDSRAREALANDSRAARDWRRTQVLDFMREELDITILDELYSAYTKLLPKHKAAMKELPGFSKGTPSEG